MPAAAHALATACAIAGLWAPLPAGALSLGRLQGVPLIGRPLQLAVPVAGAGQEPCVRAEFLQGEEPATPLQWRVEPRTDGTALLRLSSAGPVLEPVVTVRLQVGCSERLQQTHVLLAELPPPPRESLPLVESAGVEPLPSSGAPVATSASPPALAPPPAAQPVPSSPRERVAESAPRPPRTAPVAAAEAQRPRTQRPRNSTSPPRPQRGAAAAESPPAGPRLQMELLDFAIDQAPALKASTQMAAPGQGALDRTQAQAQWQRLNAPPDEQLAALQRQSEATLVELRNLREVTRLQADQLNRLSAERALLRDVFAGLAGAVAVGLALLLWWRARGGTGQPWWQAARPSAPAPQRQDSHFVDSSYPDPALPPPPSPEDDSGWSDFSRPIAPAPTPAAVRPASGHSAFGDSVMGGRSRLPSAEELLDVQEKANFFLAIGQPDQAIQMLEARLMEHLGSSPFLWLDLLDLCRRLGRRDDYERVRQGFHDAFAARLPSFDEAQPDSEGLERYPRALSRIALLWPTSRVLKEIEKSLFEDPAPGSIMFDLEASRDLLLLYSIAHEVVSEQPDGRPYDRTEMGALATGGEAGAERSGPTTEPVPLVALDADREKTRDEPDLDLDLDFSRLDGPPTAPAPVARPDAPAAQDMAPLALDFGAASEPGGLDLVLDESAPGGQSSPVAGETPALSASGELPLQQPAAATSLQTEQVDTTPPEPPLLADLQLDGLQLEAMPPRSPAPEPETPLPQGVDIGLDGDGATGRPQRP